MISLFRTHTYPGLQCYRNEGFPNGIFGPCALWAGGLAGLESCRRVVVVVGVTWKFWKIEILTKNPKCSNVHIYNFHPSKIQILEKIQILIKIPHFYPLWGAYYMIASTTRVRREEGRYPGKSWPQLLESQPLHAKSCTPLESHGFWDTFWNSVYQ